MHIQTLQHLRTCAVLLAILAPWWSVGAADVSPGSTATTQAFINAVVIDGTGRPALEHAIVLVRSGRIEALGAGDSVRIPAGTTVTDLKGKVLMPGLADMHVHLMGGWDGHGVDILGYQRYLRALLYAGVTTVLDTGNVQPFVVQMRAEIAAGRLVGPRIYCVGGIVDGADPVWPPISYAVSSIGQAGTVVGMLKRDQVDFIKAYVGVSHPVLEALVREGQKASLRVIVDQWQRNGSPDLVADGIYGFAHLPPRLLSDAEVRLMATRGVAYITTLAVYESFSRRRLGDLAFLEDPLIRDTAPAAFVEGLRTEARRSLTPGEADAAHRASERLSAAAADARALHGAGVLLTAGTDAPYPGVMQGEGLHRELELLVEAGLSPLQAIGIATGNAARFVGATDWGVIEPGRHATFIVVDGRPDRNISDTRRVVAVMIDGRTLDRAQLKLTAANDPGYLPTSAADP